MRFIRKKISIKLILEVLLIFIILGVVYYCQYPNIKDKLIVHCDVSLYIFPIYQLLNPGLFPGDLLSQYVLFQTPKGYISFFYLLGNFVDLLSIALFLPFLLSVISSMYLFFLVSKIKNYVAGFTAAVLFIFHSWTFHTFQGSTPRAFEYPFLIPFIYYLIGKRYLICLFIFIAEMLFYPPVAVLSLVLFFISVTSIKAGKMNWKCPFLILAAFFLLPFVFYLIQNVNNLDKLYGPVVSMSDMLNMSEFHIGGKEDFFLLDPIKFLQSPRVGIHMNHSLVFLGCIFFMLLIFRRSKVGMWLRLPKEITGLIYASLFFYLMAFIFLFRLYYPARYVMFSVPLFLCIAVGVMFSDWFYQIKNNFVKIFIPFFLFAALAVFYGPQINGRLVDYRYLRGALNCVSELPENALVASSIYISDPIPTFTKRKVLFSHRLLIPFQKRYYDVLKKRTYDFYDAYYADSEEKLRSFCARYSVDYIIVDGRHFASSYLHGKMEYDEPFNTYIERLVKGRSDFIMLKMDKGRVVYEDDRFLIIRTSDLR